MRQKGYDAFIQPKNGCKRASADAGQNEPRAYEYALYEPEQPVGSPAARFSMISSFFHHAAILLLFSALFGPPLSKQLR